MDLARNLECILFSVVCNRPNYIGAGCRRLVQYTGDNLLSQGLPVNLIRLWARYPTYRVTVERVDRLDARPETRSVGRVVDVVRVIALPISLSTVG